MCYSLTGTNFYTFASMTTEVKFEDLPWLQNLSQKFPTGPTCQYFASINEVKFECFKIKILN